MRIIKPRIYLASQSPRRRELLKQIGVNFEMLLMRSDPRRNVDVDETPHAGEQPGDYVKRVSRAKAEAGYAVLRLRNLPAFPCWPPILPSRWMARFLESRTTTNRQPRC